MKIAIKAYCSGSCYGNKKNLSASKYILKNVAFGITHCPDCGYVLLWKKEGSRKFNYVDKRKTLYSSINRTFLV